MLTSGHRYFFYITGYIHLRDVLSENELSPAQEAAERYISMPPDQTDVLWVKQEPTPLTARRGQILVLHSTGLRLVWQNEDNVPHKAVSASWAAADVICGLPQQLARWPCYPNARRDSTPNAPTSCPTTLADLSKPITSLSDPRPS